MIKGFTFAPANVDERAVAEITTHIHGLLGADKGYISPSLTSYYDAQGVDLQTPLRANMKEDRPKPVSKAANEKPAVSLKQSLVSYQNDLIYKRYEQKRFMAFVSSIDS